MSHKIYPGYEDYISQLYDEYVVAEWNRLYEEELRCYEKDDEFVNENIIEQGDECRK